MKTSVKDWVKSGTPWIWLNAGAVAICMIMVVSLIGLIGARGLAHFWPADVIQATYTEKGNSRKVIGEVVQIEQVSATQLRDAGIEVAPGIESLERKLLKTGNRDISGIDFNWVLERNLSEKSAPEMLFTAERYEWGNLYGYLRAVKQQDTIIAAHTGFEPSPQYTELWVLLNQSMARASELKAHILEIEKDEIGSINHELERLRLKQRLMEIDGDNDTQELVKIERSTIKLNEDYKKLEDRLISLYGEINRDSIDVEVSTGAVISVPVANLVRVFRANNMDTLQKVQHYFEKNLGVCFRRSTRSQH